MQTHHFEGLLGLATPHMELVSAHWPNLISHNPQLKERMTGIHEGIDCNTEVPDLVIYFEGNGGGNGEWGL